MGGGTDAGTVATAAAGGGSGCRCFWDVDFICAFKTVRVIRLLPAAAAAAVATVTFLAVGFETRQNAEFFTFNGASGLNLLRTK